MTLIAGIVSRRAGVPVPAGVCASLREAISRDPQAERTVVESKDTFLVKVDTGAFGQPASVGDADGCTTWICGEPLLAGNAEGRLTDTWRIHEAFKAREADDILSAAAGVFSGLHFDAPAHRLTLFTDKLGIRPLYYWAGDDHIVFASALRILEQTDLVPKVMDVRTVTEMVGLGYALADRTPYAGIKMLRPAATVSFANGEVVETTYFRWDEIRTSSASEAEILSELYERFNTAVERRNGNDERTSAYLSGGLDSRCIVGALRERGVEVYTYNFARPATQDLIFGREFAREAGAIHTEVPKESGDMVPDYSQLMADAISAAAHTPERPDVVWSGEGGSVALGHVHLSEEMVAWLRAGEVDRVIAEYIRRESAAFAPRLFNSQAAAALNGVLESGIRSELARIKAADPARSFYLYLLLNDQHRKLARHFENIDLHQLEFQLPFFDNDFLAAISAAPVDLCLRHRLYVKWLSLFPPAVTAVPWQAYPGHEPCPVPVTDDLAYQWGDSFQTAERSSQRRRQSREASQMLSAADFPGDVLSKRNLMLAALIHRTGFRDYQYLLGPAAVFHRYAQKCGGRFVLP